MIHRTIVIACLALSLLAGAPAAAGEDGQATMSWQQVKPILIANGYDPSCFNPDANWCGCIVTCLANGTKAWYCIDGDSGNDNCTYLELDCSYSMIDNTRLAHLHSAVDWRPMAAAGSCAPCGGGGGGVSAATEQPLPSLVLGRVHRYRDIHRNGSFGPGVFSFVDANLMLTVSNPATGSGMIRLFDPRARVEFILYDNDSNGLYEDTRLRLAGTIELQNADGSRCVAIPSAVRAVLTATNGVRTNFDLVRTANDPASTDRRGRVTGIADRNGNAITMAYEFPPGASDADLGSDRAKLLRLSQVSDAYGRRAHFSYAPAPISGNYVVSSIVAPDGSVITYEYANPGLGLGQWDIVGLSAVRWSNGEVATFATTLDSETQNVVVAYDDPGAEGTHRRKQVYLTTGSWVTPEGAVLSRSGRLVRAVRNGAGEVIYANWTGTVPAGSDLSGFSLAGDQVTYVYAGGNRLAAWISRGGFPVAAAAAENVSFDVSGQPVVGHWRCIESYGHNTQKRVTTRFDGLGRRTTWGIAVNTGAMLQRTAADGGIETWTRNQFKQPTVHIDAEGQRTETIYDAQGNWTERTEAVGTAVAATWRRVSNARGQVLSETDPLGRTTDYAYSSAGYLAAVTAPPDVAGGLRAVTVYTYDEMTGRLIRMRDPRNIETVYAWDQRGRLTCTTYADGSQERVIWGAGVDANLPVETRDRNGNRTVHAYDAAGRRIATSRYASAATAPIGVESCSYLPGTDLESTCTRDGDTTRAIFDARNRVIARIVTPRVGAELRTGTAYDLAGQPTISTDAYGRRTYQLYDAVGRAVRTVRELVIGGVPVGAELAGLSRIPTPNPPYTIEDRTYDRSGLVVSSTDARGILTTMTYDARRRRVSQTVASGTATAATTTWTYDAAGNRLQQTSPEGRVTSWSWTGRNLKASESEGAGAETGTTVFSYTLNAKPASVTDARGQTTVYTYGGCCDRLRLITDPAGFATTFDYDPVGNRTSVTQQVSIVPTLLLTTTTTFDARNRIRTVTNPDHETSTYVYIEDATTLVGAAGLALGAGADGSAVQISDALGHTVTEIRDGAGRTVRRIDALGQATTSSYDTVAGDLVATAIADPLGHTATAEIDAAGRVRRQIDAAGGVFSSAFDAQGNQVSSRSAATAADPNGIGWDAQYDALNRVTQRATTRGDVGAITTWGYDLDGNRLAETDALGQVEQAAYDSRNRRVVLVDRIGGVTRFAYDLVGNLVQISDADNESKGGLGNVAGTTQYAYDARNLLSAESYPQGQQGRTLRVYAYDGVRRLAKRWVGALAGDFNASATPSGSVITTDYAYDAASRLITRGYPDGANDTFGYDDAGRLTSATSARYATTVTRIYDVADRLTSERLSIDGATYAVGYAYHADGTLRQMTYPQTGSIVDRSYSARHELLAVRRNGALLNARTYDPAGRLTTQQWGGLAALTESRAYLPADYAVRTITVPGIVGFTYSLDAAGRKTAEMADPAAFQPGQSFGYDAAGRLTSWTGLESTRQWTLSKVGDWTSMTSSGVTETRTNNAVHEAVGLEIDGATTPLSYDIQGNLTRDEGSRSLAWDPENRLQRATIPGASSSSGFGAVAAMRYDALGRRVSKTVNAVTTLYLPAGAQTVVEIERTATPSTGQANGSEADGTSVNAGLTPASGGFLTGGQITRVNFQPATEAIPAGYYADTGKAYAVRTNGLSYGWSSVVTGDSRVRRGAVPAIELDTLVHMAKASPAKSWSISVPNGDYHVVVVAGDPSYRDQSNDLVIGGIAVADADRSAGPGYEAGDFDGYAVATTVTNGVLTISMAATGSNAKLCFVEIVAASGPVPTSVTESLAAYVRLATTATAGTPQAIGAVREFVYGSYVDEVVAYTQTVAGVTKRYYPHYNHLYSVAALTDGTTGAVVERFTYDAYGKQKITDASEEQRGVGSRIYRLHYG